jgi:16S rRNA (uracil1498-N3)-methyltransferase
LHHRWRVFLSDVDPAPGEQIELPREEAHHVRRVLRLRDGERLSVFDGAGREWWARLTHAGRDSGSVTIAEPIATPVECQFEVSLYQGWCEPARMEWVLQKGTELGLASIHPLTPPDSRRPPSAQRMRRWRRIAVEACKQSGRRRLPRIDPLDEPPPPPGAGTLALLLDPGAGVAPLAAQLPGSAPERVWLAVGGAEGWGASTVERLAGAGWIRTSLGPRVLRAETAGLVAATIVLHRFGDLGAVEP